VIARAREVLARLEAGGEGRANGATLIEDLPLFTARAPAAPPPPKQSAVEGRLRDVHPDALTPREALSLVYELRALLDSAGR
jgi:DNA mismatch repair protein MutS